MTSEIELEEIKQRLYLVPAYKGVWRDDLGLDYQAKPGDLFTVSFPRCGRTWMKYILWSLNNDGAEYPKDGKLYMEYQWLEREGTALIEANPGPHIITSHLPMDLVPSHPETKYIIICRNPKDVAISHHFLYVAFGWEQESDFDDHMAMFLNGQVGWGSYFDHLKSYLPYIEKENCLLIFYEDMVFEPEESFRKLALFLGKDDILDEVIEKVVENTRIDEMRKDQQRWHPNTGKYVKEGLTQLRKGKVGSWRDHMTKDQSDAFDKKFEEELKGTEAENWWKDVLKWEENLE